MRSQRGGRRPVQSAAGLASSPRRSSSGCTLGSRPRKSRYSCIASKLPPRYRSTYFSHIVGGYAAGYYAYLWSEVLDADSVQWFKENGGLTRKNGDHFRDTLLSRGGSIDAMQLYRDFRGRDPSVQPLLERRGLLAKPAAD